MHFEYPAEACFGQLPSAEREVLFAVYLPLYPFSASFCGSLELVNPWPAYPWGEINLVLPVVFILKALSGNFWLSWISAYFANR